MPYNEPYEADDGRSLTVMMVGAILATVFTLIGVFIGYLVYAPPANAYPAACAELRSECAAVMEAR